MSIDHPDLPHFPASDPPTPTEKESLREKIARQTQEFLDKGNIIKEIDHTSNKTWGAPVTLSRKEQVKTMKRKQKD